MPLRELKSGTGPKNNEKARVDIIAVHGLNPVNRESTENHAWNTWRKPGTANGNLWLKDKLPEVAPNARVLLYVYNSNPVFGASKERLVHQADDLLETLHLKRTENPRRPVIFVGHNLGGILIKQALVNAHNNRRYTAIRESTFGLAFFGTPHDGGNDALVKMGKISMAIVRGIFRDPPNDLMQALSHGSLFADVLKANWRHQLNLYKIVSFYEKEDEHHVRIVPRASAVIDLPGDMENQVGIDASHSDICRFDPSILKDMDNYEKVQGNFRELYEGALEKLGEDDERRKPSSPPPSGLHLYYDVPNRRVRSFVGREDILSRIDKSFATGRGPRIAVLQGMGGQGKSQIALEYCHRKRNNPYSAIFWVDATSKTTVIGNFQSISERMKTPTDNLPDSDARVAFVLRTFTSRSTSWLMIFDNYDDPAAFSIQDFIPDGELGAILVTSRHADAGELVVEDSTRFIELQGLEKDAALDLLIQQSQTKESNSEDAEKIVERLGYHPLAITQAGAYVRKRKIAFCKFLVDYKHRRKMILENTPQLSQYRKRLDNAEETSLNVFTTWELSFEQLQLQTTRDSIETRILTLFAFFDNKDISEQLFAKFAATDPFPEATDPFPEATDPFPETTKLLEWLIKGLTNEQCEWESDLFRDVLITLKDLSLLQAYAHEPDGFYHLSLHPLIKDWIQLRIDKSAYQENTLVAAILVGKMIASSVQYQIVDLPLLAKQSLMVHIMTQEENHEKYSNLQSTVPFSQEGLGEYISAQNQFALFLTEMSLYGDAEKMTKRVIAGRNIVFGIEHRDTLISKGRLASIYLNQTRWTEAEKLEVEVVATSKRVLGEEHPDTLSHMTQLVKTYEYQSRWTEAEKLVVQVLETRMKVLGEEHEDTIESVSDLASIKLAQRQWMEANELYRHVIKKRVRGAESYRLLDDISKLALTVANQGQWEEAEKLQVQVIEITKEFLGPEHPRTLRGLRNLARTFEKQGRWKEAEELWVQVVETSKKVLGVGHSRTLDILNDLVSMYIYQGRWKEGEELGVQLVETCKKVLGVEHIYTLTNLANLARTYLHQGRWKEAEELAVSIIETSKKVLGVEHPMRSTTMIDLAATYMLQRRYDEAAKLKVEVIETRKKVLGVDHPDTLHTMHNLAVTYNVQNRNEEAIDLMRDVVDGFTRTVGADHPKTLNSAECLNTWMLESDSSPHDLDLNALTE